MKTVIHVNQHRIKRNTKTGEREPVITCKTYKENRYGHEALIYGNDGEVVAKVVYSPDKPLSCGARVWIETEGRVEVLVRDDVPQDADVRCVVKHATEVAGREVKDPSVVRSGQVKRK